MIHWLLEIDTPLFFISGGINSHMKDNFAHKWPKVGSSTRPVRVPEPFSGEGQTPRYIRTGHEPGGCCISASCGFTRNILAGPVVADRHGMRPRT